MLSLRLRHEMFCSQRPRFSTSQKPLFVHRCRTIRSIRCRVGHRERHFRRLCATDDRHLSDSPVSSVETNGLSSPVAESAVEEAPLEGVPVGTLEYSEGDVELDAVVQKELRENGSIQTLLMDPVGSCSIRISQHEENTCDLHHWTGKRIRRNARKPGKEGNECCSTQSLSCHTGMACRNDSQDPRTKPKKRARE